MLVQFRKFLASLKSKISSQRNLEPIQPRGEWPPREFGLVTTITFTGLASAALLETRFSPRQIVLVTIRHFLQLLSRVRAQLRVKLVTLL